ncbi:MAG: glycolate oxidase subunit GlcF [bacterium]|nr:glycolate oxidase subunit GlcF [bacterium]
MRTDVPPADRVDAAVRDAEAVLRTCVHCGFCNATCPTYLLTGNELEGPRGRIYLLKNLLEGNIEASASTAQHIDNCLGCLSCETTCPSGVDYSRLLDHGRPLLERSYHRGRFDRWQRAILTRLLPSPSRLRAALRLQILLRPLAALLPARLRRLARMAPRQMPAVAHYLAPGVFPAEGRKRMRVVLLPGCAQSVLGTSINDAAIRLLTRRGAEVILPESVTCCGALPFHMGERQHSRGHMETAIDGWHQQLQDGVDAIVLTTSGCATVVRDYGHLFAGTSRAAAATLVSERTRDISQVLVELGLGDTVDVPRLRVAYHDACSMQHGLRLREAPRQLLRDAGFEVLEVPEGHICCGSAGTYNMLRPVMADALQQRKARHITSVQPDVVAAGNIGCIEQIAAAMQPPVIHTVELLDWATGGPRPPALGIDRPIIISGDVV